jgi:hypothetical protein
VVFSYYLYKFPYSFIWHLLNILKKRTQVVFYCQSAVDQIIFQPVQKYLDPLTYVSDKPRVVEHLKVRGISCKKLPVFPRAVIMCRVGAYKFPCKSIIKIGMTHGAYHFKKMTSADNFNQFDLFLMTSLQDQRNAEYIGVNCAKAVGYPKLDPAFNGEITPALLGDLKTSLGFDNGKPIVLFSATYDSSGMSAISVWCNNLGKLIDRWNILVTLHPWIKLSYKEKIRSTSLVRLIEDYNTLPFIMLADVVVGDTSSILAECCALDKPILTFYINQVKRSVDEISDLINSFSIKVKGFSDLENKIEYSLEHKDDLKPYRTIASAIFFDELDGKAGQRAASIIKQHLAHGKYHDLV